MAAIAGGCTHSLLRFAHLLCLPHHDYRNPISCRRQVEYQDRGDDADGGHTAGQYSDDEAAGYAR